jgi:hypothetical protein
MYRREHPEFRRAAYRPGLCDAYWQEMARLLGVEDGAAEPPRAPDRGG